MNSKWGPYLIFKSDLLITWDIAFILKLLNLVINRKPTSNFNSSIVTHIYQKSTEYFFCQFSQIPKTENKRIPVKIIEKPKGPPICYVPPFYIYVPFDARPSSIISSRGSQPWRNKIILIRSTVYTLQQPFLKGQV